MKAELYAGHGIPVIRGQNIADGRQIDDTDLVFVPEEVARTFPACIVRAGDLVFPHRGAIGRVAIVGGREYLLSSSMMKLTCNPELVDPTYVFYYFRGPGKRELLTRASTVGTPGIGQPLKSLRGIPIYFPSLEQQRAIAEVLGALDDKIAANRVTESTAEELISTWYRHSVNSDAVSVPLMNALDITFGEPFGGPHFSEPGVGRPLIRIRDLKTFESQVWTTEHRPKERIIRPGDVVVGMDAEFRPTWWLGTEGLLNQRVLQASGRGFGSALALEALRAPLSRIEGYKTGTTVIHLNKSDLSREALVLPGEDALNRFERQAEPVLRHRVSLATERRALADVRDLLLPQLMSGKIRVRDAERVVEGVV
ncbi:restriction endonuclease subunit S [Intrasporangium oryzae]|uniref:restriction endonuclease subunit S n=1 Tax=Intrasporangium oryzae TaxID=412687 RepID=UPI00146F9F6B|nr:restriction endonuclease subunit S [Intrasporangium oryzae]